MDYAIIAAGEGSRLAQEGVKWPKPLVRLNGVALIDRLIDVFLKNNATSISIIVNEEMTEVQDYLKGHPNAAVVNLGCGLDNTGRACDNGRCKIYNLDFPDVIALRQQLLPAGEREQNIPCDLKDPAWFDKIDASGGAVFFASGVFYYFLTQQVRELVQGMADAFPGGVLVFDAANRTAVKMIAKTWLKTAKIKDVGAYFAVSDAKSELSPWDSRLQVSSRGYMLGYSDLKDPSVNGFFRFLAKVGDGMMKMQIVKIRFSGREQEKKAPVAMKNHKAK